jgi:hypothetical protein
MKKSQATFTEKNLRGPYGECEDLAVKALCRVLLRQFYPGLTRGAGVRAIFLVWHSIGRRASIALAAYSRREISRWKYSNRFRFGERFFDRCHIFLELYEAE